MRNKTSRSIGFVRQLLELPDIRSHNLQPDTQGDLIAAIDARDTTAIYRMLIDGFSLQGISDTNAFAYISKHGNAEWSALSTVLQSTDRICPKLDGFEQYRGCRFRKHAATCANQASLPECPVPKLRLRKGLLNEQAVSLYFFVAEKCEGDVVAFIEQQLAAGASAPDPITSQRELLVAAFGGVVGVSRKLASMMLATLLLAAGPRRPAWEAVGRSMIVIDSLVHNFLVRTGILSDFNAEHAYGPRCYGQAGCEAVLRLITAGLSDGASWSPREVQHAIWRFCAGGELGICNGNNIDDRKRCRLASCPLRKRCRRIALRPHPVGGADR